VFVFTALKIFQVLNETLSTYKPRTRHRGGERTKLFCLSLLGREKCNYVIRKLIKDFKELAVHYCCSVEDMKI